MYNTLVRFNIAPENTGLEQDLSFLGSLLHFSRVSILMAYPSSHTTALRRWPKDWTPLSSRWNCWTTKKKTPTWCRTETFFLFTKEIVAIGLCQMWAATPWPTNKIWPKSLWTWEFSISQHWERRFRRISLSSLFGIEYIDRYVYIYIYYFLIYIYMFRICICISWSTPWNPSISQRLDQ